MDVCGYSDRAVFIVTAAIGRGVLAISAFAQVQTQVEALALKRLLIAASSMNTRPLGSLIS